MLKWLREHKDIGGNERVTNLQERGPNYHLWEGRGAVLGVG